MQDKISIGPVTLVQLVGLSAKPRIASVQADGAVRSADAPPSSAVAGLGDGLSQMMTEVESAFFNVKQAQSLNVVAENGGGRISMESGVDRPIADASAPASAIDPSTFDKFVPENGQAGKDGLNPDDAARISEAVAATALDNISVVSDDSILEFGPAAYGADDKAIFEAGDNVDPLLLIRADDSVFDLPIATLQVSSYSSVVDADILDRAAVSSASDAVPPI